MVSAITLEIRGTLDVREDERVQVHAGLIAEEGQRHCTAFRHVCEEIEESEVLFLFTFGITSPGADTGDSNPGKYKTVHT